MDITNCQICPRMCGVNRISQRGYCGAGDKIRIARAALHYWEEPCISGERGSGTVFFSNCSLRCCYCQNYEISISGKGQEVSEERLAQIFIELQEKGAHNINLVNPTHYVAWIIKALDRVKQRINIPIVYNSGGYEQVDTIRALNGYIDIYLPDLKYQDQKMAERYSSAANYFEKASAAILEMAKQTGAPVFDKDGMLKRGLIVRHLILPGGHHDSISIFEWLRTQFKPEELLVSLMSQYTPCFRSKEYPQINRRLTAFEYQKVAERIADMQFRGYFQQRESAQLQYTPDFDFTGI